MYLTRRTAPGSALSASAISPAFLSEYLPAQPGEIRTTDDQVIGEHQGLMFHTLGQRQGLGIGGVKGYPEAPWYVLHKDLANNVLYVGQGHEHPWLLSTRLEAGQLAWVSGTRTRGRQPADCQGPVPAGRISQFVIEEIDEDRMVLKFQQAQRAVTPGQSVVLYDGDVCLGGGIIESMNTPPMSSQYKMANT